MPKVLEKVERRLGEKLFLKGERCAGPKCALIRRNSRPGVHGKKRQRRGGSEYGTLLREKQKIRFLYGLDDRDVKSYSKKASGASGIFSSNFLKMLESRLDNAVFRLGFAESRRIARQLVNHGHILVNGKKINVPSYSVQKGDIISLKASSSPLFSELEVRLKKYEPPQWLKLDKVQKTGTVAALPEANEIGILIDVTKVKEFYSR